VFQHFFRQIQLRYVNSFCFTKVLGIPVLEPRVHLPLFQNIALMSDVLRWPMLICLHRWTRRKRLNHVTRLDAITVWHRKRPLGLPLDGMYERCRVIVELTFSSTYLFNPRLSLIGTANRAYHLMSATFKKVEVLWSFCWSLVCVCTR
jgi:hypothetical protein